MPRTNRLIVAGESPSLGTMAPPLKERMARLRLGSRELARLSGVTVKTIAAISNGRVRPQPSTEKVLDQVLTGEELELRDYLVANHGVPRGE